MHDMTEIASSFARGDIIRCAELGVETLKSVGAPWFLTLPLDVLILPLQLIHPLFYLIFPSTIDTDTAAGKLALDLKGHWSYLIQVINFI